MTQVQDEHQLSPEMLRSPEHIMSVRPHIYGRAVDNIEIAVAVGHATGESIVEQPIPVAAEQVKLAPIDTATIDAVVAARRNVERARGDSNA